MYEGKHIHFSEVDNKPLCSYSPKLCKQRRLNGYAFCIRHVLEDKTAPFKQCEFVAKYNSQRCTNPIPKSEDRRYCNSHLQVLGLVPKKERKKKNEQLEDVRSRLHPDVTMAVSLAVPSLALKTANGLDGPTRSPQRPRLSLQYLDRELDDPFAFPDDDDCALRKGTVKRKLQTKLAQNRQQQQQRLLREPEICRLQSEHFIPHPAPPQSLYPGTPPLSSPPRPAVLPLGLLCKPPLPSSPSLPQAAAHGTVAATPASHSPNGKPHRTASPPQQTKSPPVPQPAAVPSPAAAKATDTSRPNMVVLKASNSTPVCKQHLACVNRLKRLAKLCAEKQLLHRDLFPHLGLDWSEDSEEEEEEDERVPPCQYAWTLRDKWSNVHPDSEDEARSTRSLRVSRLCTYLQHRYTQLCHMERAAARQQRCRHAFRRVLLQAASNEPDYAGQLLQDLRTGPSTQTRDSSTPELSADEIPDDITNEITDMPNDLELNQEELAEVLQRLPDDLQDFDLFEGKNGELLPTTEEAEELERALEAVTSYTASLECLSSIGELAHTDGDGDQELSGRGMGVFVAAASGIPALGRAVNNELGDLLNGRLSTENFSSLELDENLLPPPSALPSPASQAQAAYTSPSAAGLAGLGERLYPPAHFHGLRADSSRASPRAQVLGKAEELLTSRPRCGSEHSRSSPYSSEHAPSPYSDHVSSPPCPQSFPGDGLSAPFSPDVASLLPAHVLPAQLVNARPQWATISLSDPATFSGLVTSGPEGRLLSTSLSTPHSPSSFSSATAPGNTVLLSGLSHASFGGNSGGGSANLAPSSPPEVSPAKQPLPQFSAAFGPQLGSHSGIPKDVQPTHSSIAPPTGFSVTVSATSTNNATAPFSPSQ
ncbi:INO80 complex subunit D-B isoform X2 [Hemitrygon akajei]|uniref:INO80 complex subunit D-B isoform X2 n=1 Tax=Hemitrygon akajei TaxID=2704970 RepID=UPI003BF9B861